MRPRCYLVGSRVKTMAGQLWKFFYKLEDNYLKSQVKVHNSNKTLFLTDKSLLHKLFFALFPVAQHQHKTVVEAWTHQGWNLILERHVNDWEIPRLSNFYKFLGTFQGHKVELTA